MPEIKKNEDGTVEVTYETGEKFKGDPMEVMNKMGEAHVSTKRWAQNTKSENESLKADRLNQPATQPAGNADALALREYLVDEQAKGLGFKDAAEYRQRLEFISNTSDRQANEQVAGDFMLACPDFPGGDDNVNKLAAKVDQMNWTYNQPNLMAAHLMCIREGAYRPLTMDEMNMSKNQESAQQQQQGRTVPPTPPQGGAPGNADNTNPWTMSQDELRKKVLEGGGLGKALMEMPTGGTLGQ